jgi:DNA modification methylase
MLCDNKLCGVPTGAELLIGDVRERLRDIPAGTVQTCITSPPYWGLRDYGVAGQIGSEKTPAEFIATMVDVFRLVRETLRDDGTLWVNLGDSYSTDTKWGGATSGKHVSALHGATKIGRAKSSPDRGAGNQLLMPHRVAMALQADGWILRSTVIWHKRSPMPESISGWRWVQCRVKVRKCDRAANAGRNGDLTRQSAGVASRAEREAHDPSCNWQPCPGCKKCEANGGLVLRKGSWRPTTGHEYVFLFSKSADYYADGEAVAELASCGTHSKGTNSRKKTGQQGTIANNDSFNAAIAAKVETRNPRTVWTLSHEPYKGAHFATFPSELVRRMLLATTPAECCGKCGAGYAPVVAKERIPTRPGLNPKGDWKADDTGDDSQRSDAMVNRDPYRHIQRTVVQEYRPTCRCSAQPGRSLILDPFAGSGTTLQVARHYGRDSVGIELSEAYAAMALERIGKMPRCAVKQQQRVKMKKLKKKVVAKLQRLFRFDD